MKDYNNNENEMSIKESIDAIHIQLKQENSESDERFLRFILNDLHQELQKLNLHSKLHKVSHCN
jgi:hypothetical protein